MQKLGSEPMAGEPGLGMKLIVAEQMQQPDVLEMLALWVVLRKDRMVLLDLLPIEEAIVAHRAATRWFWIRIVRRFDTREPGIFAILAVQ